MPRVTQPSTGSSTTRRPSGSSATTSWPGTNGNETIGSNQRDERAVDRGQVGPADARQRGRMRHPVGTGQRRAGRRRRGERTESCAPTRRGRCRTGAPRRTGVRRVSMREGLHRAPPRACGRLPTSHRHQAVAEARRRPEVLDEPAPLAGDRRQTGLGVDRDREADRLEHRQVRGRVGVGHATRPRSRPSRSRQSVEQRARPRPSAGPRRAGRSGRPTPSSTSVPTRAQTMSSNSGRERFDHEVERAGDEHRAVAERTVLADPADRRGERRSSSSWLKCSRASASSCSSGASS